MVVESSGCGDYDGWVASQGVYLGADGFASYEDGRAELEGWCEFCDRLVDLQGEFAGGDEDESPASGISRQSLDHGDSECEGLAGASLGHSDHVLALYCDRDGLVLYGGRDSELEGVYDVEDSWRDAEAVEAVFSHFVFNSGVGVGANCIIGRAEWLFRDMSITPTCMECKWNCAESGRPALVRRARAFLVDFAEGHDCKSGGGGGYLKHDWT